jgi:hypothetical protein
MPGASRPRYTNESNAFCFLNEKIVLMLEIEQGAREEWEKSAE